MGTIGPAWGMFIAAVLVAGYYAYATVKAVQINWGELFPWKILGQIGLVALTSGLICYPLVRLNLPKLTILAGVSLVYTVLYVGFLLAFRLLNVKDKAL